MRALFNCNMIRNVYLHKTKKIVKLVVEYTDTLDYKFENERSLEREPSVVESFEGAYNDIVTALQNDKKIYVEIELP